MDEIWLVLVLGAILFLGFSLKGARRRIEDLQARLRDVERDVSDLRAESPVARRAERPEPSPFAPEPESPELRPRSPDLGPIEPVGIPSAAAETPALAAAADQPAAEPAPGDATAAAPITPPQPPAPPINWEQFMGVKLFAWVGGLALFLGVAFFVKYSFEHDLVPPELRVALGFLTGLGLLVGGLLLSRRDYAVTAHTLCGTGVVILYAVTFACRSIYHFEFFGLVPTFALMVLITATAFLLAVRLDAKVVAILGMLGGFLTPALLSTGQDNPAGLFGYIALLDAGLVAVALHQRWGFLVAAGAAGTVLTELAWAVTFFSIPKLGVAIAVFLGFGFLFLAAFVWADHRRQADRWVTAAAIGVPFVALGFAFSLLSYSEIGQRPGGLLTLAFVADLCLLALVWRRQGLAPLQLADGATVFVLLGLWTLLYVSGEQLEWALGAYLVFGILHSAFPVALQRARPGVPPGWWAHLFPALALFLVMACIGGSPVGSLLVWPVVLLIDLVAIALAVVTATVAAVLTVLVLTMATMGAAILRTPVLPATLPAALLVIGGFGAFFLVAGLWAARRIAGAGPAAAPAGGPAAAGAPWTVPIPVDALTQIPSLSAILPFLLLIMATAQVPLTDPSPVFGLALGLIVLLLGLARALRLDWLPAVGLGCVLALEQAWQLQHLEPDRALLPLTWHLGFFGLFAVFPFLCRAAFGGRTVPWAVAALSGPLHFYLVYRLVTIAYPNGYMGLVPAAFALPPLVSLVFVLRTVAPDDATRTNRLAWFGGATLFFVTLVFPIQFDRQWISISWGLEGAALLWLFQRVPHPGLRLTGVALLGVSFVRLALNPAVLAYHPRSQSPILNWYLYAYGVVSACLFAGARLLAAPRMVLAGRAVGPVLAGLGTVLVFLLLNIEIADYFSPAGATLTFEFRGDLAQDMTYSIAWGLFAIGLLVAGMRRALPSARYAALGLLSATLLKLFFHDLARLGQLYRVGALIGVAIIAMVASFLYQRFLAATREPDRSGNVK
jgi:uncharacterized membrane protein